MVQRLVYKIDKHEKNMERLARDSSYEYDTLSRVMQTIKLIKKRIGLPTTPSPGSPVPSPGSPAPSWGFSYVSDDEENRDGSFEYSESEPGNPHRDTPSPRNPDMNPRSNDSDSGNDWDEGSHIVRRGEDGSFSFAS